MLFGGDRRTEKELAASAMISRPVVWVPGRDAHKLVRRVDRGHVAGVVLLQGLIGHVPCEGVAAMAKRRGVPTAFGDRAGTGSLARAFLELESKLTAASRDRAA